MNLQAAADALGVHYQTAYRWVREGQLAAGKIAGAYDVDKSEVERFLSVRLAPAAPPATIRVRDWTLQVERFETALREGNELTAREIVDRLSEGNVTTVAICQELITPCMRSIGEAWHNGNLSVAHEHRATAMAERMLARLANHQRGRPRGTAVVTTPPGEHHGLPAAMAALVLREDRWKVHHLGADTPLEDLAKFSFEVRADVVVLSSTLDSSNVVAERVSRALESLGIHVLTGGPGMTLNRLLVLARAAGKALEPQPL
jgi:MerR family transcriptional regulator, light-induced transcriptional regulator